MQRLQKFRLPRRGPCRRAHGALLVFAFALCAAAGAPAETAAQSGRRGTQTRSPVPPSSTPAPDPEPKSKTPADAAARPLASFVIFEDDNAVIDLPLTASSYAVKGFVERLKDSPHVSVGSVGKGDRRRARERAKVEKDYHVILVQLDENSPGRGAGGPIDLSNLMVRYYVFAPGEATLKVQGQVPMRPYRGTATVGGVRLPVPTPRVNVPFEYIVEQAGRDAAERVMAAFNLRLPPDRY